MPREGKPNSTPPPGASPARKGPGKQSKAGRREVAEREKAERGRNIEQITCCSNKLIEILSDGGVSEPYLDGLRNDFYIKVDIDDSMRDESSQQLIDAINYLVQADNAVKKSWTCASCYPSIDVNALIVTINDLRSLLCARAKLICKYAPRKLGDVRADPKADPTVLETAVKLEKIANDIVTKCNIGAYKARALLLVATKMNETPTLYDATAGNGTGQELSNQV